MAARLTRNGLLMLVGGELSNLNLIPANPMDLAEIATRAHLADRKTRHLAHVIQALVPSYNYGGLTDALKEWATYQQEFGTEVDTQP